MKKACSIILTILITNILFGQIDINITNENWKVGNEKVLYGNRVIRLEGNNGTNGITNIAYETFAQVKSNLEKKAENEMWTEEKKNEKIESFKSFASGGIIHLYLTRLTIGAANTKYFTVIVKDSSEKEIYREELKNDIPNTPASGSDYWWNTANIYIKEPITGSFYIYVIDALGREYPRFKFEVKI